MMSNTATTTAPTATTATPSPPASCVATTLAHLTEDQRIGQLFLVGLPHNEIGATVRAAIRDHHLGSWWFTEL